MNDMKTICVDALVVGTGAAGYNAAIRICQEGKKTVAMVTEGVSMGTSRNTGSDKQTYYKLGLGGSSGDSVRQMAADLFAGGAVDGDNALCEAALSSRCFLNLCELGVPFPVNRYGEYIGYKTDHDPYARATSAGPLTSKFMTEALEKKAQELNIPVYDRMYAVEILKDENGVCGLLCLSKETGEFMAFSCPHIVLATGGPAGIYADSVFPAVHTGSSSLAFLAGAQFQNMTEWQYGLASVSPRWNVSGTYMQVLPRFVSIDENGVEREFLLDFFGSAAEALSTVFLKGYQWPFDSSKVLSGSSVIDLLVYRECAMLGRKVYLDYRTNPFGLENIPYNKLSAEARTYLKNAGSCFGTPIDRLLHMNAPAEELYRGKGVDLTKEMLEIALCAQHNNGGISVDLWWQTTLPGLYAAGECAGTHGIARPGGSALNAGQVGSLRAAQFISQSTRLACCAEAFEQIAGTALRKNKAFAESVLNNAANAPALMEHSRRRMSSCGAAIRQPKAMEQALTKTLEQLRSLPRQVGVREAKLLYQAYQYRDTLVCQAVCLASMLNFAQVVGATRGSALYYNDMGEKRCGLPEAFRFTLNSTAKADMVQQGVWNGSGCEFTWRSVRPLPAGDDFFENVWRTYRENLNRY